MGKSKNKNEAEIPESELGKNGSTLCTVSREEIDMQDSASRVPSIEFAQGLAGLLRDVMRDFKPVIPLCIRFLFFLVRIWREIHHVPLHLLDL